MDATAVVNTVLTIDMNNFIKGALHGLSDADLAKQPSDQCNSIGWTLWHATRVEDGIIANISSKPQVWMVPGDTQFTLILWSTSSRASDFEKAETKPLAPA